MTGSGFFETTRGPNRPSAFTESSFTSSGDVIVNGSPSGDNPLTLKIGDGHVLNATASGAMRDLLPSHSTVFSSDVSQAGEIHFANSSSSTYIADILMMWTFDVSGQNASLPDQAFVVEPVYFLTMGTRTATTGSDFFTADGFNYIVEAGANDTGFRHSIFHYRLCNSSWGGTNPCGSNFRWRYWRKGYGRRDS